MKALAAPVLFPRGPAGLPVQDVVCALEALGGGRRGRRLRAALGVVPAAVHQLLVGPRARRGALAVVLGVRGGADHYRAPDLLVLAAPLPLRQGPRPPLREPRPAVEAAAALPARSAGRR